MSETKDPMIAALLREREGYVQFGRPDRIKAVDAELKRRGYAADEPKGRQSRQAKQATADSAGAPTKDEG